MTLEAKVRRIGTGYGILIPKRKIEELGVGENDIILIKKIEKPAQDIRGILKRTGFSFERAREGEHEFAVFGTSTKRQRKPR